MTYLRYAGWGMVVSAVLHIVAFALGGAPGDQWFLAVAGIVYLAIGAALLRGVRMLACVTFVIMLVGINIALANAAGGTAPVWAYWGIFAADVFVAVCLFIHIWNGREGDILEDAG